MISDILKGRSGALSGDQQSRRLRRFHQCLRLRRSALSQVALLVEHGGSREAKALGVALCACGDQKSKETINRPIVDGMITDAPIELAGATVPRELPAASSSRSWGSSLTRRFSCRIAASRE